MNQEVPNVGMDIIRKLEASSPADSLTPEHIQNTVNELQAILDHNAPLIGAVFGLRHITIKVGEQWETNVESHTVTAGIGEYLRAGRSMDMALYGIFHEVAAHLRELEFNLDLSNQVREFLNEPKDPQLSESTLIFYNIFSDIAGNKLVHATVPNMGEVAKDLYSKMLFANDDYTGSDGRKPLPRHFQFLYKLMREEMIPGSQTTVYPEVDALIQEFRNFNGNGDLISYSTQVASSRMVAMSNQEKFDLWTKVIYPRWLELFKKDENDPQFQQHSSEQTQTQENNNSKNSTGESSDDDSQADKGVRDEVSKKADFSDVYRDYKENIHPESINHEQLNKIEKSIKKQIYQDQKEQAEKANPNKQLDAQIRLETGHSLTEKRIYDNEVVRWQDQISELRDIFKSILNDRISTKRHLRGNHTDGALLNPETLVQTYIDVQTNHPEPPAYADYESKETERRVTGKTDYVFVFDRSGSMIGEKSRQAASSLVICLEALAAMQRDIKQAELEHNVEVDIDIRTAIYTFNHIIDCPKILSPGLSDKERLDSFALVRNPNGANSDSLVLADIQKIPIDRDRKQILIVVSDGKADDKVSSRRSIEQLRANGWEVFGVSIGSDEAVRLYSPMSERVDDPSNLPNMLLSFIKGTLA